MQNSITIETIVARESEIVWKAWTTPEDICQWNAASVDWECPKSTNDLRVGGEFHAMMSAKDGSASFDFNGIYSEVIEHKKIAYTIEGGRKVVVEFQEVEGGTRIVETFEMEDINSEELQRAGWQSILDNFKQYVEEKY